MFTLIGHLSLILSLLLTLFSLIYLSLKRQSVLIIPVIFLLITLSLFGLIYSYLLENMHIFLISSNSHSKLPLFYKLAAVWSSHEGSILLWSWIISFYAFILTYNNKHTYLLQWLLFILFFFISFTWIVSNPFLPYLNFKLDGLDLNPILQDPFLVIHPPILYLGYVGTFIPFLITILYLKHQIINLIEIKLFTFASWIFLTLGILLGSWWAYYELGWGGYWFWDPVENIALLPWISSLALIHSLNLYNKTGYFSYWIILFSSLSFFSSIIGTLFVRSGLLASVHSFISDNNRGIYLLIFILILLLIYFYHLLKFHKIQQYKFTLTIVNSKENSLLIGNWLFILIFILITFGTFMPTFYTLLLNKQVSIGPHFYNYYLIPLIILLLLIMILTPLLQWKSNKLIINLSLFLITTSLLLEIFICVGLNIGIINHILTLLSITLIINTIYYYYLLCINKPIVQIYKSMIIGHIGIGLLILVIVLNNEYEIVQISKLVLGNKLSLQNYDITLTDINELKSSNFNSVYGDLIISYKDKLLGNLNPDLRYYGYQSLITNKSIVVSNYLIDMFATLNDGNIFTGYTVKLSYKPYMPLLWLSGFIIIMSGILGIRKLTNNNKARGEVQKLIKNLQSK